MRLVNLEQPTPIVSKGPEGNSANFCQKYLNFLTFPNIFLATNNFFDDEEPSKAVSLHVPIPVE